MSEINTNDFDQAINRQNVLNNTVAVEAIKNSYSMSNDYFTNQQVADFFDVNIRTIERTISENREELEYNGFLSLKGKKLTEFQQEHPDIFVADNIVGHKTRNLAVSSVRTVLNFAMLLKTSEKAREVRSRILDIVVSVLQEKSQGNTKYINQRDTNFLEQSFREATERKQFTNALNKYVDMNAYKYAYFTDEIYKAIFKEKAKEYKKLLQLDAKESMRDTLYSEVLVLIASFEAGIAYEIEQKSTDENRKLTKDEVDIILQRLANHPAQKPLLDNARTKMASRDYGLRSILHDNISEYINPMNQAEFEKFLGEKSKSLQKQIDANIEIFKRLKDK
ncbi:plasmid segregation protein ParM [Weissella confusa]|uniref:plasmid segregation protein ParM n=1 Tax=Weissella confusa TaxID=1583 RepID=UPI00223AC583|nr:plasmid segregation protein ParM [Weissella confusa]MCT0023943.1 DNA-binding protein [Weissella confusa]